MPFKMDSDYKKVTIVFAQPCLVEVIQQITYVPDGTRRII